MSPHGSSRSLEYPQCSEPTSGLRDKIACVPAAVILSAEARGCYHRRIQ